MVGQTISRRILIEIKVFRREPMYGYNTSLWEAVAYVGPVHYHGIGRDAQQAVMFLLEYMRHEGFDRTEVHTTHAMYALEGIL